MGATRASKSLGLSGADCVGLPGGSWPWPYRIADEEMAKRVAITNRVLIARFVAIGATPHLPIKPDTDRWSTQAEPCVIFLELVVKVLPRNDHLAPAAECVPKA